MGRSLNIPKLLVNNYVLANLEEVVCNGNAIHVRSQNCSEMSMSRRKNSSGLLCKIDSRIINPFNNGSVIKDSKNGMNFITSILDLGNDGSDFSRDEKVVISYMGGETNILSLLARKGYEFMAGYDSSNDEYYLDLYEPTSIEPLEFQLGSNLFEAMQNLAITLESKGYREEVFPDMYKKTGTDL